MTDRDFYKKYTPIKNHLDKNSAFDGCMFETYGEEIEFVLTNPSMKIWTIIDEDDRLYIGAGFRIVNRIGFMVTDELWENPWETYKIEEN